MKSEEIGSLVRVQSCRTTPLAADSRKKDEMESLSCSLGLQDYTTDCVQTAVKKDRVEASACFSYYRTPPLTTDSSETGQDGNLSLLLVLQDTITGR